MGCKAVLFDMDGVLIDSETFYVKGTFDWMQQLGYQGPIEGIYQMLGTTMEVTYQILAKLLHHTYTTKQLEAINERYFAEHPLPYDRILKPGVWELLHCLKDAGILIAVCSSSPQETIETAITECGIRPFFDFVVSGEQFVESKPNPQIYLHAAEVLNVAPKDCLVVEDSTLGIQAGRNAGMRVIALRDPQFELDQHEATWIVDSMQQAQDRILQESAGNSEGRMIE